MVDTCVLLEVQQPLLKEFHSNYAQLLLIIIRF